MSRRRRVTRAIGLALSALFVAGVCLSSTGRNTPAKAPEVRAESRPGRILNKAAVLSAYGRLPLVFERNQGQSDSRFKYLARAGGYTLFLTGKGAVLNLHAPGDPLASSRRSRGNLLDRHDNNEKGGEAASVCLALKGSDSNARVEGLNLQPGHDNYLIGNDPSGWHRNVPLYARVKYHNVYPGIDAVYYGNQQRLETDYIVAPGSDPARIALQISGAQKMRLSAQGDLRIETAAGELTLRRPNAHQTVAGTEREIAAHYILHSDRSVALRLGAYDASEPLVIDPVVDYSTYLGGNGSEFIRAIATDSKGDAFVSGNTSATNFPTTAGAYQTTFPTGPTGYAFITELNPTGTALVFSTFIGGTASGSGDGIAVDPSGNVYVAGTTLASDFPTTPTSYQPTALTGGVFFSELDPTGSTLLYSTYLAGASGAENAVALAIALNPNDGAYNGYVLGRTSDTNFPITSANAYQASNNTNQSGVDKGTNFVSRIDPSQAGTASLVYSTYLGGSQAEFPESIAVDANENAYIIGNTSSADYPTVNAFLSSRNNTYGDVFVSRIDTTLSGQSSLVYSTYFGGPSNGSGTASDVGDGIAVQPNSVAVVAGYTYALQGQFPLTAGALETASDAPNAIAFLARFDTTKSGASSLLYSSTWGGSTTALGFAVALDAGNNIYMTGATADLDFPVTPGAPMTTFPGRECAFLTEFNSTGTSALFSTYWGGGVGPGNAGYGVATDSASPANVYFTGITSSNFPTTTGALQTTFQASGSFPEDGFVVKMSPGAVTGVFLSPAILNFGNVIEKTQSAAETVTLFNDSVTALTITGSGFTIAGANAADFTIQTNTCPAVGSTLAAGANCTLTLVFTPSTTSAESATFSASDSDPTSPQTLSLSGTGTTPPAQVTLTPSPVNFGSVAQNTASAPQTFTLSNNSASALTITGSGFTVTGANASDFSIQTNNCPATGSTLAAGSSCTLVLVFTPSTTSAEAASLSASDSDPSSPQVALLAGSGSLPAGTVTLMPNTLNFNNVNVNSTSSAQTLTLMNSKTTSITISKISIAGANASEFAEKNQCGSALAASASCAISVTFSPNATGAASATLSVLDSDPSSPQTATLSGTGGVSGPDFTITALPTSATVATHGTATTTVTITSLDAFSSAVNLSCATLPGDAVCSFSPGTVTPAANGTATSTVTINTSVGIISSALPAPPPNGRPAPLWIWILGGFALVLWGTQRMTSRGLRRAACALALLSIGALASCSNTPSTHTGTYAVELTGQSGSTTHAFTFILTVH